MCSNKYCGQARRQMPKRWNRRSRMPRGGLICSPLPAAGDKFCFGPGKIRATRTADELPCHSIGRICNDVMN